VAAAKAPAKKLKGNPSWRPATGDLVGKDKDFGYRKVRFDNVARRLAEGWQLVDSTDGAHTAVDGGNRVFGGKRVDSLLGGVGFVYMRLPQDGVDARNEYINGQTSRQKEGLLKQAERDVGLELHGGNDSSMKPGISITNNRPVKQTIE
jgi:hypothetical protein